MFATVLHPHLPELSRVMNSQYSIAFPSFVTAKQDPHLLLVLHCFVHRPSQISQPDRQTNFHRHSYLINQLKLEIITYNSALSRFNAS